LIRKTVYIHIGTHKTGTTAIQLFSKQNKNKLKELDTFYPSIGCPIDPTLSFGHHLLPWYLSHHPVPDSYYGEFKKNKNLLFPSLIESILSAPYSNIVLSSEEFDRLNSSEIKHLKQYFKSLDVKIVIYLRRKDTLIESLYQTKVIHNNDFRTIEEVIKSREELLDYYSFVTKWQNIFGKDNVLINLYCKDILKDKNIVLDFYNKIAIDITTLLEENTSFRVNVSVPFQYVALIANLGRKGASQKLLNTLKRISKKIKNKNSSYHFLSLEMRKNLAISGSNELVKLDTSLVKHDIYNCFDFSKSEKESENFLSPLEQVFADYENFIDSNKD
jgi:hypothetical protein